MAIRRGTLMATVSSVGGCRAPSIDKTGSISMQENADGRVRIESGLVSYIKA
jgi:hypothetical protein